MNQVDESGKEISILVDTMDVIDRVTPYGGILAVEDRLDMVLGRRRRISRGQASACRMEDQAGAGGQRSLVRRLKKWTCVLTLQTGVVGNNTNLKVMFNWRRHSAYHCREAWTAGVQGYEVAVLRGRGTRVQQLQVRSAGDGLDWPYAADQGQGGELYRLLRGQGGSSGGQHGVPGDDQEGSEGTPIGRAGGHGHREGQPEVAATANSKAARE